MATCYKDFAEKYPKAFAVRRIPLDFLSGAAFEQQADSFLRDGLRKGIPSLFSTLRPLYKKALGRRELTETYFTKGLTVSDSSQSGCQARVATVGKLVEGYLKSLRETSKLPGCNEEEAPTVFLWVLYFLAQHRDMLGDQVRARRSRAGRWRSADRAALAPVMRNMKLESRICCGKFKRV